MLGLPVKIDRQRMLSELKTLVKFQEDEAQEICLAKKD